MLAEEVPAVSTTSPHASTPREFKSLWKLGGLTPWQLGRNVFEQIIANDVFGRAAELAFSFLFALFPLILLMVTSFGLVAAHRVELQSDLLSYFADFLPPSAFRLLRTVTTELAAHASGRKLAFGIVTALWCISGGISSMISALNSAYHVRETRPWFKVRAIAIGLSLLIPILLFAALLMMLIGGHFVDRVGTGLRLHPLVIRAWNAIQWPGAIFFVTVSCSLIYYYGPDLRSAVEKDGLRRVRHSARLYGWRPRSESSALEGDLAVPHSSAQDLANFCFRLFNCRVHSTPTPVIANSGLESGPGRLVSN